MIDWIGYGWIAGEVSGPNTYFADLTIEVPRGDVVAAAAVTGFSVGVQKNEPGSDLAGTGLSVSTRGRSEEDMAGGCGEPPACTGNVLRREVDQLFKAHQLPIAG